MSALSAVLIAVVIALCVCRGRTLPEGAERLRPVARWTVFLLRALSIAASALFGWWLFS
jgi:hypothetical protein